MQLAIDDTLRELGRWVMETVMLRQALSEEQQEIAKLTTEVGSLRMRHEKLSATAMAQQENLIALNQQLMGNGGTAPTSINRHLTY